MSDRILAATKKGLFVVERGGGGDWAVTGRHFVGDHLSLVHVDKRTGTCWACFQLGHFGTKVHRSEDGGSNWTEMPKPTYPEKPEGTEDKDPFHGKEIPWDIERVWSMASGHRDQPGVLWLGTIPGGLFRTSDDGNSWELVRSLWDHEGRKKWFGGGADLPGIHSILVHPDDGRHLIVGVSCGGVWETRDACETWNNHSKGMVAHYMPPEQKDDPGIQDPHQIVQCPAAPDHLWAQHHNGIFHSTDGAASWTEISEAGPSTFGFAVAVHPTEPGTAWFIPGLKDEHRVPVDGKLVVTRTRDGGQSFDVLTEGLPQQDAYDLVYRHGLDIDESGDRLAFGSTTGSLWVTEDQGDSWQSVSHHLPPIDCVRFV